MPKVIQVNTVSNYGSTGKIMEAIGLLAKASGWDSKIAVGRRYSRASSLETYTISNILQNYLSAVYSLLTDRHGFANKPETKCFVNWLKKETPDVIHLHNFHSYIVNIKQLFDYLSESGIPVIWTLHDCWPFTGHCSHFIGANCYKWQTGCNKCPNRKAFPSSLFFDKSLDNYRDKSMIFNSLGNLQIVTVSRWLGDCVRASFLGHYPITVIANGVDLNVFYPKLSRNKVKYNLEGKKVLLGVSTDWCKAKGLNDYLELRKVLPEKYSIVLVGMKTEQVKEYSRPGFVCIEKTNRIDDLVDWYNAADIVLNLSYAETFGLPVAEGYACGKPAIVYDNTALSELITPETGIKVKTGNLNELTYAIETICSNSNINKAKACRNRAEIFYDKEKNYRRYIDLYNEAVMK